MVASFIGVENTTFNNMLVIAYNMVTSFTAV